MNRSKKTHQLVLFPVKRIDIMTPANNGRQYANGSKKADVSRKEEAKVLSRLLAR